MILSYSRFSQLPTRQVPPIGEVQAQQLILSVTGTNLNPDSVRAKVDRAISEIQWYLTALRGNVQELNSQLSAVTQTAIEQRRSKLLADRNLVASLGFLMKERPGEERTYVAPSVQRKIAPALPTASSAAYKPEPMLADTDYDHILSVLQNMVHVMERSPSAFASMDEEALRSHFLVQLNGHYEGQATGETFNYEGKTDILIRADGKNIFIGECKFWSGPRSFPRRLTKYSVIARGETQRSQSSFSTATTISPRCSLPFQRP